MNELQIVLSETEDSILSSCEERIARNEAAALDYLDAFRTIRDQRLYRDEFTTFEEYCLQKWNKSYRAIARSLQADDIIKQLPETCRTAAPLSDRTALALKNVKPNSRPKVLKRAIKAAGHKPISPTHIRAATTDRDYSGAYASPKPPAGPTAPASKTAPDSPTAPPPLSQPTIAHLEAIYAHHKTWLNDLPLKSPRQILDCLINHL